MVVYNRLSSPTAYHIQTYLEYIRRFWAIMNIIGAFLLWNID